MDNLCKVSKWYQGINLANKGFRSLGVWGFFLYKKRKWNAFFITGLNRNLIRKRERKSDKTCNLFYGLKYSSVFRKLKRITLKTFFRLRSANDWSNFLFVDTNRTLQKSQNLTMLGHKASSSSSLGISNGGCKRRLTPLTEVKVISSCNKTSKGWRTEERKPLRTLLWRPTCLLTQHMQTTQHRRWGLLPP